MSLLQWLDEMKHGEEPFVSLFAVEVHRERKSSQYAEHLLLSQLEVLSVTAS
jgi:hypothetical protein